MVSCAFFRFLSFINMYINCIFFLCQPRGLGRRWRVPTESLAGDDQVSHPLIPVVVSYFNIISFSCYSRPYPSHTSLRGIAQDFLRAGGARPRDRRLGLA